MSIVEANKSKESGLKLPDRRNLLLDPMTSNGKVPVGVRHLPGVACETDSALDLVALYTVPVGKYPARVTAESVALYSH